MTHLRATRKVLHYLGPPSATVGPPDALLGDWFVNRFEALSALESRLERMPCRVTRPQAETVFPADLSRELLTRRVN